MDFLLYRVFSVWRCRLCQFISVQSGSIWRSVSVCRISRTCFARRTIVPLGPIGCSASVAIQSLSFRVFVCLIFGVFSFFSTCPIFSHSSVSGESSTFSYMYSCVASNNVSTDISLLSIFFSTHSLT